MVGKTYLRYGVGPQGGAVASNASLTLCSAVTRSSYAEPTITQNNNNNNRIKHNSGKQPPRNPISSVVFTASLEAVRVYSVRSGALQHTLIPAEAKMPLEVTSLRVVPLESNSSSLLSLTNPNAHIEKDGWMLLVGYHNGHAAVFSCGPTSNYGLPICKFYALGHKADTAVLALAVDEARAFMCSGGQDTDLTVWDLMTHEAAFRLRGHRGGVVGVEFVPQHSLNSQQYNNNNNNIQEEEGQRTGNVLKAARIVVTGAADGLIKVWDISIRQCIQTIVASDAQVASLRLDSSGRRLYCGLRENQLKVFNTEGLTRIGDGDNMEGNGRDYEMIEHGSIIRKLQKPITSMSFSHDGAFLLACTSKTLEVFRILTREDVRKKVSRKRKRRATKKESEADAEAEYDDDNNEEEEEKDELKNKKNGISGDKNHKNINGNSGITASATASEEVVLLRTFFLDQKVRSACFIPPSTSILGNSSTSSSGLRESGRLHIAVTFNDNNIRTFTTALSTSELEGAATWTLEDLTPRHTMEERGHQSDIRELLFIEDDTALLSLSAEKLMMWNVSIKASQDDDNNFGGAAQLHDFYDAKEANVLHADASGSLTCTGHVPLNDAVTVSAISANLCCVGQQDGSILLVDLPASSIIFIEPLIHIGGVKHVTRKPDNSGFVSVGVDRRLIVWTLALMKEDGKDESNDNGKNKNGKETNSTNSPQLVQSMEIELTENPLFVSFSPDNRFMAIGLQNNNIQLFFADTMKPYLSLFGHKLPPTAAAFSSDGTLIATVGMDKSLRFWGTDFGDCHRAIHAHDDYVTQVKFLHDTHQLLTVSLDGSLKHWDGDNWTMIQMFRQHQRGVWAVTATLNGTCIATAGVDKCIRCFTRSHDIVFPQEEEERLAQEAMDEEAARRAALQALEHNPEVAVAGQQTTTTAAAAEKLMEALDLISIELQRRDNPEDVAPPHPLLMNKTVWEYLWSVLESVRPSEVRHALAALTSTHVDALLNYLEIMLRERAVLNYEMAAKIVLALVAAPAPTAGGVNVRAAIAGEISESHGARRLDALRRMIAEGLDQAVGRMDYNIAGLQFVRHVVEEKEKARFFDLSKIQGYKKRYHSRVLDNSNGDNKEENNNINGKQQHKQKRTQKK